MVLIGLQLSSFMVIEGGWVGWCYLVVVPFKWGSGVWVDVVASGGCFAHAPTSAFLICSIRATTVGERRTPSSRP